MKSLTLPFAAHLLLTTACGESKPAPETTAAEPDAPVTEAATVPELEITPIEHATMVLSDGERVVYVDPVGGAAVFDSQEAPDVVLVTDIHGDHLDTATLAAIVTDDTELVVPQAVADQLNEALKDRAHVLANGEKEAIDGIEIDAVPMYNLREEAKDYHTKGRGNGYVLTLAGQRVYVAGDTEGVPEMRALENIDVAFVPMNLPYTMPVADAADAVLAFAPKKVYPFHYRGQEGMSDVSEFEELVSAGDPDIEVVQLDWYPRGE